MKSWQEDALDVSDRMVLVTPDRKSRYGTTAKTAPKMRVTITATQDAARDSNLSFDGFPILCWIIE